jgi:hypothetical protein
MAARELQARLDFAERRVELYESLLLDLPASSSSSATGGNSGPQSPKLVAGAAGSSAAGTVSSGGGGGVRGLIHDFKSRLHSGHAAREEGKMLDELARIRERRREVRRKRQIVGTRRAEVLKQTRLLSEEKLLLSSSLDALEEEEASLELRRRLEEEALGRLMRTHVVNDAFHVWYSDRLGTINGFRVGKPVPGGLQWVEVNAGLGQAALALSVAASALGVKFTTYAPLPMGSYSKIVRPEDGKVLYNLFSDESFSLFPHRNLNQALKAFLHCLRDVGLHVSQQDPTLQLPHKIDAEGGMIGGLSVALGSAGDNFSRAMKFMLTDIKWIIAFVAKYSGHD